MGAKNFKLQQQVEICKSKSRVKQVSFKGNVVYISNHFITVQNKDGIRESFQYVDFSTGEIQLKC